jgi:hypothetical protein
LIGTPLALKKIKGAGRVKASVLLGRVENNRFQEPQS